MADIDNLRFYQRRGFRAASIMQDAFTPEGGYQSALEVDGILSATGSDSSSDWTKRDWRPRTGEGPGPVRPGIRDLAHLVGGIRARLARGGAHPSPWCRRRGLPG